MTLQEYLKRCDLEFDEDWQMMGAELHSPGYHTTLSDGMRTHPTCANLDYALALVMSGRAEHLHRATQVIRAVLALQETDPTAHTYGIWPWHAEEPLPRMNPPDWNWADFCGARLAAILKAHAARLPGDLVERMRIALGHAGWSIFRRNVLPGYTNIAIMGAVVTAAAGELLHEPRLLAYGRRRFETIVEHTAYHGGFNEYNSPTYTTVALRECERALHLVNDPAVRAAAEALRRVAWETIADHFHPGTGQWAGPCSRAYSDRLSAGLAEELSAHTGVKIAPHPTVKSGNSGPAPIPRLPCPEDLRRRFQALPEDPFIIRRRFIRRESEATSTIGTTWLCADACLGTVNRDSFWVQTRALLGYWKAETDPAVVLRLRFLRDGKDFASAELTTAQEGPRALSAVRLLADRGSHHPTLDRPADGVFPTSDLRLRYEITGEGVMARRIGPMTFALVAEPWQAVIHGLPGRFGEREIHWECGGQEGHAWVDAVLLEKGPVNLHPQRAGDLLLGAGMELIPASAAPSATAPQMTQPAEGTVAMSWPIAQGLALTARTGA